jgi:hypothetical protein
MRDILIKQMFNKHKHNVLMNIEINLNENFQNISLTSGLSYFQYSILD